MNAVAEHIEQNSQVAAPVAPASSLVAEAVRAGLPMETIRELRAMAKEDAREVSEQAFVAAMNAAQSEMRPIAADAANPQTRSRYASYAALDRALRPIYTKHGFSLSFDEGDTDKPDHIRVLCYVSHRDGFTRTYRKDMPADGKGAKGGDVMTKTHAAGAADTYGMRYLLKKIFNVAVGEDDTDGNMPDAPIDLINIEQRDELLKLIAETGADTALFCRFYKIEAVPDLPANRFQSAKAQLLKKKEAK